MASKGLKNSFVNFCSSYISKLPIALGKVSAHAS